MNTQFNSNVIWLQLEYKISTLEALGSGIGTGSIFCLSFSLSNRVAVVFFGMSFDFLFDFLWHTQVKYVILKKGFKGQ